MMPIERSAVRAEIPSARTIRRIESSADAPSRCAAAARGLRRAAIGAGFAAAALLFGRTWIYYRIHHHYRRMPLLLGLFLVALFIWIAENLGTLTKTWLYPHQMAGWSAVSLGKLGSWFLLLIISYALVAIVNRPQKFEEGFGRNDEPQPTKI